jgi:cytochrome c oxidase assembly factor CtaG
VERDPDTNHATSGVLMMTALALSVAIHVHHHAPSTVIGAPWAYHLHLVAWAAIGAVALGYGLAVRRLARTHGPGALPTRRQFWCLAGGLLALVVALTWPVADLAARWSLTALLVQRLLLTLAAAPLLLLAMPVPLLAALTRPAPIDAAVRALTRPVAAVIGFSVVAIGTLVAPAVAAQSSSAVWRGVTDVALLVGGAVLWGPTLRHLPGAHRTTPVGVAAYLFVQSVVPTFPAIVYVFAHHPLYPAFAHAHRAVGLSALVDQQVAGVVAKVATLPVLWTAAYLALARAQRVDAATTEEEPLTWATVERELERAARAERRVARGRRGAHPRRHAGLKTTAGIRTGDDEGRDASDPPGSVAL